MERADNWYFFFPHVENVNFSPKIDYFFFLSIFFYEMQVFIHEIKQSLQIIVGPFQAVLL